MAARCGNVVPLIVQGRGTRLMRHNRAMWQAEVDDYVAHLRAAGQAASTVRLRQMHLARALTWLDCPPFEVTTDRLTAYMAGHDWAPETRKSVRSSLCSFYGWAESTGRIPDDPARRLPRVSTPAGKPKPAPTDVVAAALSRAEPREALMVMLAAYAGLRRAEVAGLHADDILEDTLRVKGKGGKVREVPMHPLLAEVLAGRTGFIFPGNDHGHLSPDRVGRILSGLLGLGWTAHTLRHRFATRAYAADRDLLSVQQLLGHASVATTQRYTKLPDDALRRAVLSVA